MKECENLVEMESVILHALRQAKYIEEKLENTFYYVDPISENYKSTTALICRDIIFQSCIQIEAIAKKYYCLHIKEITRFDFSFWGKAFPIGSEEDNYLQNTKIKFIPVSSILLPEPYGSEIKPWLHEEKAMPTWWNDGYNCIKHDDNTTLKKCTYENALLSLSGLYAIANFVKIYYPLRCLSASEFKPKYFSGTYIDSLFKK